MEGPLQGEEGYFQFDSATCFGRHSNGSAPKPAAGDNRPRLPFDLTEIVTNLRLERYQRDSRYIETITGGDAARNIYYFFRPMLPVAVRRHLQKIRLSGWQGIRFPSWPVDFSVETLMQSAMTAVLTSGHRRVPFIWFWPDGAQGCLMMTHDVEGPAGRDFCGQLMDIDDSFCIKSAFQLIPDMPSTRPSSELLQQMRKRGFEVNLHDLNHDGHLFDSKEQFLERAERINQYAREYQCGGFRSAAMYREQDWYEAFDFSYDMSVPNVAHLEPQRGGCCTVMPYFIGNILELPLTTTQDYSLFHILGDYSIDLWKEQIALILGRNGLISFITHPDYLIDEHARAVYRKLLQYLLQLRASRSLWTTLPAELNRWWRNRSAMTLVSDGDSWRVEGPDSGRARIAYATLEGGRLVYRLGPK